VCELCEESDGMQSCQDCGRMICFDHEGEDDICAPAYVTESGDLYCSACGRSHDRAEEDECDDDGGDVAFLEGDYNEDGGAGEGDDDYWDDDGDDDELDEDGDEEQYFDLY
jgi:hypothetical protein